MRMLTTAALLSGLLMGLQPGQAAADTVTGGPWQATGPRSGSLVLAAAGTNQSAGGSGSIQTPVDAPWYHRNNVHKYLGLGSIAAAAIAIVAPKKEDGPHEQFAKLSAGLGVAAVGTGLYSHWDDLSWEWSNPDTKHATLGTIGALGFLLAVARGGEGGHAGAGAIGAIAMLSAIKITW
jgi:hypothetical protein